MKYKRVLSFLLILIIGISAYLFVYQNNKNITSSVLITSKNSIGNTTISYPPVKHIFVIVEENHDWQTIYNNIDAPYIKTLLPEGAYASNYHNIPINLGELHPSELNYTFLEAGSVTFSDHTFSTDDTPSAENSTQSQDHLAALLTKKGLTWKSYQEDISGNDCPINEQQNYAPKHNPFVFFQDVSGNPPSNNNIFCQIHIRPLGELKNDIATGNIPNYVFITPNLNNDMHNGDIGRADAWLSQVVPLITHSDTFKKDGVLFITWDEGGTVDKKTEGNNPIGMIIVSPFIKRGYTNNIEYSHASLLKTIEEIFNVTPLLGLANDSQTKDLFDLFQVK